MANLSHEETVAIEAIVPIVTDMRYALFAGHQINGEVTNKSALEEIAACDAFLDQFGYVVER